MRTCRPKDLELTASDELLALDNLEILRQNGFEIDTEGSSNDDDATRCRLRLVAQPVSKSTVFDVKGDRTVSSHVACD